MSQLLSLIKIVQRENKLANLHRRADSLLYGIAMRTATPVLGKVQKNLGMYMRDKTVDI